MLNRYRDGQVILGEDHATLLALLARHPEADQKIGCGVKHLYKDKTEMPTSCFWIERIDGTKTDFSYRTAIAGKGKSLYQEFVDACRAAVQDDIALAKKNFFNKFSDDSDAVECELTGEKIRIHESHVDHKEPLTFQVLVDTFLGANNIKVTPQMLSTATDNQFQTVFTDLDLKDKFRAYHHKMAQLRIIKVEQNLSLGGSKKITKPRNPVTIQQCD